jgi:hypothetical protein
MTFEERAYAVLFEDADESLLTEGELYELYDTISEITEGRSKCAVYATTSKTLQ